MPLLLLTACSNIFTGPDKPPVGTGELKLVQASLSFVVDEHGNERSISVDPASQHSFPIFGDVWLNLIFSSAVAASSIPASIKDNSTQPYPENIRIKLDSSTQEVVLPTSLVSTDGKTLSQEYRLGFDYLSLTSASSSLVSLYLKDYPELRLNATGSFPVAVGEAFVIQQNWPLARQEFETILGSAFAGAEIQQEWIDDTTVAITIITADKVQYELSLMGIRDGYGYVHESMMDHYPYAIKVVEPTTITQIIPSTGEKVLNSIPMSISDATSLGSTLGIVKLYRHYFIESDGIPYGIDQYFYFDTESGQVVGEVVNERSEPAWQALSLVREYLPSGVVISHSGLSPSGKTGAAIYWNAQEQRSYLLWADLSSNVSQTFLLDSRLEAFGSGKPSDPILWSHDESSAFYYSMSGGKGGIHSFDLDAKQELMRLDWPCGPLAISPTGAELIYGEGSTLFMLKADGSTNELDTTDGQLEVVSWIEKERILVNRYNASNSISCYFYYPGQNSFEFISVGRAFAYDPLTGNVFTANSIR